MGRVSDMAIGLEEEARDELLCEIDHWKARATDAERPLKQLSWDEMQYRHDHDHYGRGDIRTGRAWDLMRRSGDKARAHLDGAKPQEDGK